MTYAQREALRRAFKPNEVKLLFVGESAPASGRFFYSANSGLYRAVRRAFQSVEPSIQDLNFLNVFQASGCYLTDLCPEPVDDLDPKQRRAACLSAEGLLARRIKTLQPGIIATVVKSIESNVSRAAARAEWKGEMINLPYPGRWSRYRGEFVEKLRPVIGKLIAARKLQRST